MLQEKLRDLKLPARLHRRYQIVAAARAAARVPAVARRVGCDVTTAYHWVVRFNRSGFATFEQPSNPRGRIPIVTAEQLRELMDVALSSPLERGLPFAVWSVPKLAAYAREHNLIPPFCDEWVRRLLRGAGLSAQRIRTCKTSPRPCYRLSPYPRVRRFAKAAPGWAEIAYLLALLSPTHARRRRHGRRAGAS